MDVPTPIPRVLTIAGSDSGGGAGIQADLKAFAACGVHGMSAITAITAQNTLGVSAVHTVPPELIVAQVQAVQSDIGVDAVKIGMLADRATIGAVSRALGELPTGTPVVLDPVMVAESGAQLLEPVAVAGLLELLLPRVTVITPNLAEAGALVEAGGVPVPEGSPTLDDAPALARALHQLAPGAVVVTGGHREHATDVFFDGQTLEELPGPRYRDGASHGSGCTHSSVLAARLAWGDHPLDAARVAREMAARAVGRGLAGIGAGVGPVDVLDVVGASPGSHDPGPTNDPAASRSRAASRDPKDLSR